VIVQLYAPPLINNYLGVEYLSDLDIESTPVTHHIDFPHYSLISVDVEPATFHPLAIPESDPRYKVYTSRKAEQDQQK